MWNKIIDSPKIKTSTLIADCRKLFPIYFYNESEADLDFPAPKKKTTRTFAPETEVSDKHANKSYNQCQAEGIPMITIREYLIMATQYFKETGKMLDKNNWTLTGSVCRDGHAVGAGSSDDGLGVDWYSRDHANPYLRSRDGSVSKPSALSLVSLPEILEINGVKYKKL